MTRSIKEFRPRGRVGSKQLISLLGTAVVVSLLGGWLAALLARALPSLAGLTLPIGSYTGSVHLFVSVVLLLRVGAELAAANSAHQPVSIWEQGAPTPQLDAKGIGWLFFRFALFAVLAAAFLPSTGAAILAGFLMVVPQALARAEEYFPRSKALWRVMPFGIFAFATILVLEIALETSLSYWFGEKSNFSQLFVFSLLPMVAIFGALQILGRQSQAYGKHWWELLPRIVRRTGAVATFGVLAVAMQFL